MKSLSPSQTFFIMLKLIYGLLSDRVLGMNDEGDFHGFRKEDIPKARDLLRFPGILDTDSESECGDLEKAESEEDSNRMDARGEGIEEGWGGTEEGGNGADEEGDMAEEQGQEVEEGGQVAGEGGQGAEVGGQKADEGEQNADKGGQGAEERGREAEEGGKDAVEGVQGADERGQEAGEGGQAADEEGQGAGERGQEAEDIEEAKKRAERSLQGGGPGGRLLLASWEVQGAVHLI